ncbi:MAG: ArsC family transcriptional regulator [Clostridia bacterium]|nr:ArsC family transcriptional regulator [Clostridia bacterium]
MNLQIYMGKKNFDTQKAIRFFKERRIRVQEMDLKKHPLGEREVQTFARGVGGARALLDLDDPKVQGHTAAHNDDPDYILSAIREDPWLMRTPVVRNGNRVTVGYCPDTWEEWIRAEKA